MIGKEFNEWTVVGQDGPDKWKCECSCGNFSSVKGAALRANRSVRCHRCAVRLAKSPPCLDGKRFGRWTVIAFSHKDKHGTAYYKCECECGGEQLIARGRLSAKNIGGCMTCKANRQKRPAYTGYWSYIKANAHSRNIEFAIEKEETFDLLDEQNWKCALSGENLKIALGRQAHMKGGTSASLDRIDSTKGYVRGNIQWVHKDINRMKSNLPEARFVALCAKVSDKHAKN